MSTKPQQVSYSEADLLSAGATLCYIYTLHASNDPECRPRYVGFTLNPKTRQKEHHRRDSNGRKGDWIRALKLNGEKAILTVVYVFRSNDVTEQGIIEASWIEVYRKQYKDLLNDAGGGRGIAQPSEIHRKRKSDGQKRRYEDKNERDKVGEKFRRFWSDPEAREKQKEAQKRRNENPEDRLKRSVSQKLRWGRPEERRKLSEKLKHFYEDPIARQAFRSAMNAPSRSKKLSDSTKRHFQNTEARERAAQSAKRSWENPEFRAKRKATFERKRLQKLLDEF